MTIVLVLDISDISLLYPSIFVIYEINLLIIIYIAQQSNQY